MSCRPGQLDRLHGRKSMKQRPSTKHTKTLAASALALAIAASPLLAPTVSNAQSGSNAILTIGREGNTVFTRNFNPFSASADLGTVTAIYEPLVVYTPSNGKYTPW